MKTRSTTPLAKTDGRQRAGGTIATSGISIEQIRSSTTIGKINKSNASGPHMQRIATWEKRGGSSALKNKIDSHADDDTISWLESDRAEVKPVNGVPHRSRGNNNNNYSSTIQFNNPTNQLHTATTQEFQLIDFGILFNGIVNTAYSQEETTTGEAIIYTHQLIIIPTS